MNRPLWKADGGVYRKVEIVKMRILRSNSDCAGMIQQACLLLAVLVSAGGWANLAGAAPPSDVSEDESQVVRGEVDFKPLTGEQRLPERFRMSNHRFEFKVTPWRRVEKAVEISRLEFPSPVKTPHTANNQVHCEYFQPLNESNQPLTDTPGVIVLHILGGDFELSRAFCMALARRKVSALFLKMPYYGPRRGEGVSRRMISEDPEETVEGMTQAILDIRRAAAWLGAQKTVDDGKLGIFGISLGGITGALATSVESRLHNACLLLAGGDYGKIIWESKETARIRESWLAMGRTREEFEKIVAMVDPVHFADRARARRILMLNAKSDEIVPFAATDSLWRAFGKPPIVWYEGGHYSVAANFFDAIKRVGDFFEKSESLKIIRKELGER